MDEAVEQRLNEIRRLCCLANIELGSFVAETEVALKERLKRALTPSEAWFREGKSVKRYWEFLEAMTSHTWEYQDVDYWYRLLRDPSDTREAIPESLRYEVLTRDKSACQKCGRKAPDVELQVDHIVPWDYGGPTVKDNLRTLCRECNSGKSNKCFE